LTIKYKMFNQDYIENIHGQLYFYRDLYLGNHMNIFERAQKLREEGEILENMLNKSVDSEFSKSPYIIANVAKLIVDVPAMLVARSMGKIDTSQPVDEEQNAAINQTTDAAIEGPNDNTESGVVANAQQELIKNIVESSKLDACHRSNVIQQQVDGGLVGVPWNDDRGLRIEFKGRDTYFPHEDGLGADISISRTIDNIVYLHVYRDRLYKAGDKAIEDEDEWTAPADGLRTTHRLFLLGKGGVMTDEPIPFDEMAELLNMDVEDLEDFYEGRKTVFIRYWGNDETIMNPLGVSALYGQDAKQDEINWSLTRNAFVFERNGKPRIAINKELANAIQKNMIDLYGEKGRGHFDSKKLEIFTMDDNGNSMEIFQIDITKIGDVQWVKDLTKLMLMETRTSEKAIDFYMDNGGGGAQSGIAKFYDLFISLMKADQLLNEYLVFIKALIEDALWLAHEDDAAVVIEKPEIIVLDMLPLEKKEITDDNIAKFEAGVQSLETTVRNLNPDSSEEYIQEEMLRLELAKVSSDSTSLGPGGAQTLESMMDNPNLRPPAAAADETTE